MSSTNTSPSPSHAAKTEKSVDDLFQIIITIKDNQESMRKSLEQRMTNLEKNFTREIKENMDKLKSEMTLEFAQVDNKIKELETKMKDVEFKLTQNVNIENSANSVHPKLVFKNVQPIDNESEESLKVYANGLLRALELDFDVLKVERITAHLNRTATSPNQRPKPLIVSFADETQLEAGVRQGDNLAPTLFAVFVDDLVTEINRIGKGINIGTDSLSCLLYDDDIVLISDTVDGLQSLLHCVTDWSKTWRLQVNTDKTKIMHVRKASKPKNDYEFQLNNMTLETVSKYRYLGLVINENLDYKETTNELVSSGSRSLGSLVSKYYAMDGMDFDTYTKIFDSTVLPILEYGSGVWGHKRYDSLERLQYRAIRTFLGVSLTTPIPAITGDMGWYPIHHRIQVNIVRLYCKIEKGNGNVSK
ncbi:unnamed protein product [Mytilus edulis]|uniref:Reverse transcriptase domain-containing protein n=1 Tax=Mytilus edulis TaxID=6550 RepID=A0A8S3U6F0_MYTED|nr:unnamed protein product [Mytilus edulis]